MGSSANASFVANTLVFGGVLLALAGLIYWICLREQKMRRLAKPAKVKRVVGWIDPSYGSGIADAIPDAGVSTFTTEEYGDSVVFSLSGRVFVGQTVGIYIPEGGSTENAIALSPFP